MECETQQALFAAEIDQAGNVQEWCGQKRVIAYDPNLALLLYYEKAPRAISGILQINWAVKTRKDGSKRENKRPARRRRSGRRGRRSRSR